MYNGVKHMIEREIELTPEQDVNVSSALATYNDLTGFPIFPAGTKSLLSKFLSRDVWHQLRDSEDKFGFTFKEAIFSGCKNTDSGIGVYAGSHHSYSAFAPLFD
jgi:hypothetical protein